MRQQLTSLVLVAVVMMTACKTMPIASTNISEGGILLDQINELAGNDPGWFENIIKAKEKNNLKYRGETNPAMAVYLENDFYIYEDQNLSEYIKQIAQRLLKNWQGPQPQFSVIIETDQYFNAYVDELNQLHVSTGLLRNLDNEDQLASVIAHEVSHILLRHNREKSLANSGTFALDIGGVVAMAAGQYQSKNSNDKRYQQQGKKALLGFQSLGLVWADMLSPKWARQNEREADKLGMDLLIRANYNYEEFSSVIEKIHDAAIQRSQRANSFSKLADSIIKANKRHAYKPGGDKWDKRLGDAAVGFIQSLKKSGFNKLDMSRQTHANRNERIDALKQYLNSMHGGGDLPPEISVASFRQFVSSPPSRSKLNQDQLAIETINALNAREYSKAKTNYANLHFNGDNSPTSSGIAKSSVEISSKKYDIAIIDLDNIVRNLNAPAEAYIKLAESHIAKKQYGRANAALSLGVKRIGRDFRFLPSLVKVNKMSGDIAVAENYALKCKDYDGEFSKILSQININTKIREQNSYYKTCTRSLGYDVAKKRERDTQAKKPTNKSNKATSQLEKVLKGLFK